jgi:hypothetical protein
VHHLAIGKNIPLEKIAGFFEKLANHFIIEFIPKQDEKVQLMLSQKKDIYSDYTNDNFEVAFQKYFLIKKKQVIGNSGRTLYLMRKYA